MLDLTKEFPLQEQLVYLNHAAVAPWPKRACDAINDFTKQNLTRGATDYPNWIKTENRLRIQLRQLINAKSSDEIALVKNTSEALSLVAYGLEWKNGDNIVSSNQEFPSNRIVWESLAEQGVEFRQADLASSESPEEALMALCNENTRLLTISSVQYASGLKIDLHKLGNFCRNNNILFCVDAIQSLGAQQFDVQAIQADFVMADGHKWMLGPEGLGLFYCRKEHLESLKLSQYGWHMIEAMGDYNRTDWSPAKTARRFECGSPNMLAIHALYGSLSLLLELGMKRVEEMLNQRVDYLLQLIYQHPELEVISATDQFRRAGIVTFRHNTIESAALHAALMQVNVICAARGGGVRFSPHFYTPTNKLDEAMTQLQQCINKLA